MADSPNPRVSTDGGSYIAGDIHTAGGDFAGRDIIYGYTAAQVIALIAEVRSDDQPITWDGRTPYLGLDAFQEADAEFFFGREKLVEELLLRVQQARFVCVAGPSGSGKSSLVQAGLVYALQQGKITGSDKWLHATLTPRGDPIEQLAQAMARLAKTPVAAEYLRHQGPMNPNALHEQAETLLGNDPRQRLIVYVDQFEELFTQTKNEEQRRALLALLTTAAQHTNGRVKVIVALRADFVAQGATYPELRNLISQQFQLVGALEPEELARAIVLPSLWVGADVEPKLVEQLIADMQGEPGALPLLQFALKDLFDAQTPRKGAVVKLTLADYLQRGGIQQALERHAEAVFNQFTAPQQQLAHDIFTHLIEVGRGTLDTRRTAAFAELVTTTTDANQVDTVVQILAQARLITVDDSNVDIAHPDSFTPSTLHSGVSSGPSTQYSTTITLAHEKLIDAWPWLRRLVDENRDAIALQNELSQDAEEWEKQSRDPSYLYSGAHLTVIQEQLVAKQSVLYPLAQAFLNASQATDVAAKRQRQRDRYFQVSAIIGMVGLLLIVLLINQYRQGQVVQTQENALTEQARSNATIVADVTQQAAAAATIEVRATAEAKAGATAIAARASAEREAAIARSRQLSTQSTSELSQNNYEPAILLAIEAGRITDTREAFAMIRTAIANGWHERTILYGHTGMVWRATWNKDESRILTSSEDGTARIWDAATGKELAKLTGHTDPVSQATWNKDEARILTSSYDNTARIWDAITGKELVKLTGHTDFVYQAMWNQDGSRILTSSQDGTVRIWDAITGKELVKFIGHTKGIIEAAWNKDESRILTASDDGTARIWDTATGKELVKFTGHTATVNQASWSRDESRILTASDDDTARIWDAATGKELVKLNSYDSIIRQAAIWSPDSSRILTATSSDQTARIWDATTGKELVELIGDTDGVGVWQATWNRDGSRILIIYLDHTARVWDAVTGQALVKLTGIYAATWSQDGSRILIISDDNVIRICDAATGQALIALGGHLDTVLQATWSKDENHILTSSYDGTARIWDAATGQELVKLTGDKNSVNHAIWNKNESRILTTGLDGTVNIWYVHMADLIPSACRYTPRNFTWDEWQRYMGGAYHPICPNVPIPPDAIAGITDQIHIQVQQGQVITATAEMQTLNHWLHDTGQYDKYGIQTVTFFTEEARSLAQSGNITNAIKGYQQALKLDPTLTISPVVEANHQYASTVIQQAAKFTESGNITDAVKTYQQARALDPTITISSELEIKGQYASIVVKQALTLAANGAITASLQAIDKARRLDPNIVIAADTWNSLCWDASIFGHA